MLASLDHIEEVTDHIRTFWFNTAKPLSFSAGQFTQLSLNINDNTEDNRRWFTISSSPTEKLIGITTKFCSARSYYKHALSSMKPGDNVQLSEPMGDFVLPKSPQIPLLFIAAGIGITPVRSIIKYLSDREEHRNVSLLYAANHESDLGFIELFNNYIEKKHYVIEEPSEHWTGATGILSKQLILSSTNQPESTYFFISGPESMVNHLGSSLISSGIKPEHIISDSFLGYKKL